MVKRLLWAGRTLWGLPRCDSLAALDWSAGAAGTWRLARHRARPVDGEHDGSLVRGPGRAHHGASISCCLADYDALLATGISDLHGEYFRSPG